VVHDISEQKKSEEQLRRYAAELERSNSELQDFAYVSSHDLQEPLRKIQAFGTRLKSGEYDKISDKGKDYIDRMLNAASRMQRLINALLDFSRVTTKAKPFTEVNLNQVLQDVISDIEIAIESNHATINFSDLPTIEGDEVQMRQLFQNLIGNAIKFKKEDIPPTVTVKSKVITDNPHMVSEPGDQFVEITFSDNGIGFDQKYGEKIFNIFQRLEGMKYEGSGVGLAICKKIVTRHGGSIRAQSIEGKGSDFIVLLSLKQLNKNTDE